MAEDSELELKDLEDTDEAAPTAPACAEATR